LTALPYILQPQSLFPPPLPPLSLSNHDTEISPFLGLLSSLSQFLLFFVLNSILESTVSFNFFDFDFLVSQVFIILHNLSFGEIHLLIDCFHDHKVRFHPSFSVSALL